MNMWMDPPSGWRYGFPKVWNQQVPVQQWLVDNGYPEQDADWAAQYMRSWPATGGENESVA